MKGNAPEERTVQKLCSFQFRLSLERSLRCFAVEMIKVGERSLVFQEMFLRVVERGLDYREPHVRW